MINNLQGYYSVLFVPKNTIFPVISFLRNKFYNQLSPLYKVTNERRNELPNFWLAATFRQIGYYPMQPVSFNYLSEGSC